MESESSESNIFSALFTFRPRDNTTPKENFLSEAFVYALRTHKQARVAWLKTVLGYEPDEVEISTRLTSHDVDSGRAIFPDVEYRGSTVNGPFVIRAEHKWDSGCDLLQLRKYARLFKPADEGDCHLVFIGATQRQKGDASTFRADAHPGVTFHNFLWEDIYRSFSVVSGAEHTILQELLGFMEQEGLSPGAPMRQPTLVAFLEWTRSLAQLKRFAEKLRNEYDWDVLPERYRSDPIPLVTDKYGRVAIEFTTEDRSVIVTTGFLYNGADHRVGLTKPARGVDLMLRVETDWRNDSRQAVAGLRNRVEPLQSLGATVLTLGERGNGNKHTLLIAQKCLAEIIENRETEPDQLDAIALTLRAWLGVLFADGSLEEEALLTIAPH